MILICKNKFPFFSTTGKIDREVIWQEDAPVTSILYDCPITKVKFLYWLHSHKWNAEADWIFSLFGNEVSSFPIALISVYVALLNIIFSYHRRLHHLSVIFSGLFRVLYFSSPGFQLSQWYNFIRSRFVNMDILVWPNFVRRVSLSTELTSLC